jgi:lipooligosaccharide transport system ATP-binding protein
MSLVNDAVVSAKGLTKRFGDFVAVNGIDLEIYRGEVFGFLGPNGAGKTSTMRMIACMSPRTSGELTVRGLDPDRDGSLIRAGLGVVPQEDALDGELTVLDNLIVYGRYFDISKRAAERARKDQGGGVVRRDEAPSDAREGTDLFARAGDPR